MYRELWIGAAIIGVVYAQDVPPTAVPTSASLSVLKQAAETQTDAWETLSKSLPSRIAGLLPCDPKLIHAVEEVRAASEARLNTASEYFRGALARAGAASSAARSLLSEEPDNVANGRFIEMERTEAERERRGIDGQTSQLVASSVVRRELSSAEASLREIAILVDRRNMVLTRQVAFEGQRREALTGFMEQLEARESALKATAAAFENEAARWRAYYAARLDRSKVECEAISPVRRRQAAKKK